MNDKKVVSLSGDPIYRHEERVRPFEPAVPSEDVELLEDHIEAYIAPIDTVLHEVISDLIHLDVHWIKPCSDRPFHTLVTTGMSDLPMRPVEGAENCKYAELLIALPAEWQLSEESFKDEKNYWPIRLLKWLARLPHEYETWLWWGHTIPYGDPPSPFDPSTEFTGAILAPPLTLPQEFYSLRCSPEKEVHFFAVIPLYTEEMNLKLRKGADHLFRLFDKHRINELIDLNRTNVGIRWWNRF